jgi:iron complex outermembrane receptor protein
MSPTAARETARPLLAQAAPASRHKLLHLACLSALTALALSARAQAADPAGDAAADTPATASLGTVTIVGSRAKVRTVFDSDVPVDVFSGKEVERALASGELGQALQNLSPSVNMPRASASGTADTVRAIQLRGLAPDEVLVLVNGKRWHPNATMDQEGMFQGTVSVDLNTLPPGAIDRIEILRDGAGAQYGSDAVSGVVNIVLKRAPQGSEAYASMGGNRTHFAPTGKTINDGENFQAGANTGLRLGDGGYLRLGFDYQDKNGTNRAGPSADSSYFSTPADTALVGQVLFRSGDPDLRNTNLFYNAALPLTPDWEVYSFATHNTRHSVGAGFFRWPGDPGNVPSVYPNGFLPRSVNESTDTGFVAGARGNLGEWNLDLSLRIGNNAFNYGLKNSINSSIGASSPTSFHLVDFISGQTGVNIDAHRSFDGLLPSPVNVGVGAELQRDTYTTRPGDPASYAAGSNPGGQPGAQGDPGLQPQDAVNLGRTVKAVYIDVDSDLTQQLLIGAAARYADMGASGSKTTGKLSARYKFTPDLLLRGSLSNSFRAPALAQIGFRNTVLGFDANGNLSNVALVPATDALAQAQGAQPLRPETSTNATLGLALRMRPNLNFTLDAYRIKIKDRIALSSPISVADPSYPTLGAVNFLTNALDTTTEGLDAVVTHDMALAGGTLNLSAAFNHNRNHLDAVRTGAGGSALFGDKTLYDLMHESPNSKLVLSADWTGPQWSLTARATRFGTFSVMSYDPSSPPLAYAAAWTLDLEAQYKFNKALTFTLGGNNVTNTYPTRTTNGYDSYSGAFPYNFVSPVGINGAYFYGRVAYAF